MGIFLACVILLIALFAVVCSLINVWASRTLLLKCKEFSVEDLVNDESVSFPVHVKMNGKGGAYYPLTSPIASHPNCFRFSSIITYHYDTMTEVRKPCSFTNADGTFSQCYTTERQIDSHSVVLYKDSQCVNEFALIGSNGARVMIDVTQATVIEPGTTDRFHHKERRDRCDSSYYTLRNPSNAKFEFRVDRALPIPYKEAWFEMEEEWTDLACGHGRLTVFGVATKDQGVISIGAIKTCLGERMIITDWSIRTHDRVMIGFNIGCFLLALITLPLGLAFLFKSL